MFRLALTCLPVLAALSSGVSAEWIKAEDTNCSGGTLSQNISGQSLENCLNVVTDDASQQGYFNYANGQCNIYSSLEGASSALGQECVYYSENGIEPDTRKVFIPSEENDAYIQLPATPIGGAFTISVRIKVLEQPTKWERIFDFGDGMRAHNILMGWYVDTGELAARSEYVSSENRYLSSQENVIPDFPLNEWLWVTMTSDGTNYRVYKNSELTSEWTGDATPTLTRTKMWIGESHWSNDNHIKADVNHVFILDEYMATEEQMLAAILTRGQSGLSYDYSDLAGFVANGAELQCPANEVNDGSACVVSAAPTAAPTVPAAYIGENNPENDKGLACGGTSINMDHHWENIDSRMHVDFPVENQINFQVHGGPNSQGMNIALVDKDNLDDANSAGLELFIGASSEPVIHLSTCIGCAPFIYENIAEKPLIVEGKSTRGWVKINGNTVSVGTGGVALDGDESDDVETEIFSTTVDNIPTINRAVFAHGFDDVDCHVIPEINATAEPTAEPTAAPSPATINLLNYNGVMTESAYTPTTLIWSDRDYVFSGDSFPFMTSDANIIQLEARTYSTKIDGQNLQLEGKARVWLLLCYLSNMNSLAALSGNTSSLGGLETSLLQYNWVEAYPSITGVKYTPEADSYFRAYYYDVDGKVDLPPFDYEHTGDTGNFVVFSLFYEDLPN